MQSRAMWPLVITWSGLYFWLVLGAHEHSTTNNTTSVNRREVLTYLLNPNPNTTDSYDPRVPPDYEEDFATDVTIKIHLLSFDSVSETTMDYSVEIYIFMQWTDKRLMFTKFNTNFTSLEVDSKIMDKVWVPDVYFRNEKKGAFHDVTVPNKYMHIYKNGTVSYSLRLSLTLSCRMRLQKYPLDTQHCPMVIQSYTYTTENVMFKWAEGVVPVTHDKEITLNTELPQFSIVDNVTESCNGTMDSESPKFACIKALFTLKRDIGYYIIQIYVPSILIVTLSWVSFWLDVDAIPARVSLGVLTVLTLNTHGSNVQSQLPKLSYIKAIDVWVVSSLIFVFAAFLEFAYVNVLARRGYKEMVTSQMFSVPVEQKDDSAPMINGKLPRQLTVSGPAPSRNGARRVDKLSRILFPLAFSVFNIAYWLFYIYI
ncbi:unnamed protein product [Lymnaea stagnalis]|uniref:Uncharacterized protein n=1 Tax=Lymnaea stagnalis TaxID=6523 RepID=A0AAV2I4A1_LYMST